MRNLSQHSDEELLALIARDDERAFEVLFDRYWEVAHMTAASKLKSDAASEEIVQDIFLSLWERRRDLRVENFSRYLQVAVKYKALTYISQQLARSKRLEEYQELIPVEEERTLGQIEYDELMKALEQGVRELPAKTQAVFRMNRLEGQSVSEIASQLNLSEKAIEYHITRSRKELRLFLRHFLSLAVLLLSIGV